VTASLSAQGSGGLRDWKDELDADGDQTCVSYRLDADGEAEVQAATWPIYARGAVVVAVGWAVQLPGGDDGPSGRVDLSARVGPLGDRWGAWRAAREAADAAALAAGWTLAPRGMFEAP
jgi:hypothetical protein